MASKGTSGKSASGASMSKYDIEVEARLKKLEAKVNDISNIEAMVSALETAVDNCKVECASNSHSHESSGGGGDVGSVVAALKAQWPAKFANL
jgi:hypothetical protein